MTIVIQPNSPLGTTTSIAICDVNGKDYYFYAPKRDLMLEIGYFSSLYRIRGNFRGLPIFAVFRGQYESAKIKIAKYFPISVKESS